jgi:hypothetical protein
VYRTNLQISSGTQQLYVPVSVDVLATHSTPKVPTTAPQPAAKPTPTPKPTPKPSPTPKPKSSGARKRWFNVQLSERARSGLSLGLGAALAGAGGAEAVLQQPAYAALLPGWLPVVLPLAAVAVLGAALGTTLGRVEPKVFSRLFTALLLSALGVGAAFLLVRSMPAHGANPLADFSPQVQQGVLWTLVFIGAVLGAALGATQRISGYIMAGFAFLRRRAGPLFALAFITAGGALGWVLMQPLLYGALAPCGLIVGLVLCTALVVRMTRMRKRVPVAHP